MFLVFISEDKESLISNRALRWQLIRERVKSCQLCELWSNQFADCLRREHHHCWLKCDRDASAQKPRSSLTKLFQRDLGGARVSQCEEKTRTNCSRKVREIESESLINSNNKNKNNSNSSNNNNINNQGDRGGGSPWLQGWPGVTGQKEEKIEKENEENEEKKEENSCTWTAGTHTPMKGSTRGPKKKTSKCGSRICWVGIFCTNPCPLGHPFVHRFVIVYIRIFKGDVLKHEYWVLVNVEKWK